MGPRKFSNVDSIPVHIGSITGSFYCTSGTFWVLTVASLQRLKMESLIPAPADSEVQSVLKFLDAQSIVPIEIPQLRQVYGLNVMSKQTVCSVCMMSTVTSHPWPCGACAWTHFGESLLHNYGTQQLFAAPCCTKLWWSTCRSENCVPCGSKATDTRTQSKVHAVSIDICAAYHDDSDQLLDWIVTGEWNVGGTHYTRNQAAGNALVSQWSSLQDRIQADFVGVGSDVHMFWDRQGILLIDFLTWGVMVNAERYCRAIQNKQCGMLSDIVLLHDNAWPHTAWRSTH